MTPRTEFFSTRPVPKALFQSASLVVHDCPHDDWASNLAWLRDKIAQIGVFILPLECGGGVFDWARLQYIRDETCEYSITVRFNHHEYASGKADHRILEVVMALLRRNRVETTWYQPKTKVTVDFGIKDPDLDLSTETADHLNASAKMRDIIEQILAPMTTRCKVSGRDISGGIPTTFNFDNVQKHRHRLHLTPMFVTCPSPSIAKRLISLEPITSHAPYTISFKADPKVIHVGSCCTIGIKIEDDDEKPLVDPFCHVVTEVFSSAYPGKHTFTLLSQALPHGVYTVTASNIYLACFLTQLPSFFDNQFYHLSSPSNARVSPNSRQTSLLGTLQTHIEAMITARLGKDRFSLAAARRSAVEVLHKLATTAELSKIGGSKLTEATSRLGRVERDLVKMMDSEMDLKLETVTSLCTRLQKSMAELRDVEVALARVEKWYRDTGENDRKKKGQEESTVKVEHETQADSSQGEPSVGEEEVLATPHQLQEVAVVLLDPLISQESKEVIPGGADEIDGTIQQDPLDMTGIVPAKRDSPDEEDDSVPPVRPYKQPEISHFESLVAELANEIDLPLGSPLPLPATPQRAVPLEYTESL